MRGHRDSDRCAAADRAGHCVESLDQHALSAVGAAVFGDQRDRIADAFDEAGQHQTGLIERSILPRNTDLRRTTGEQRQHRAAHHGWTADARRDQVGHPDGQPERIAHAHTPYRPPITIAANCPGNMRIPLVVQNP